MAGHVGVETSHMIKRLDGGGWQPQGSEEGEEGVQRRASYAMMPGLIVIHSEAKVQQRDDFISEQPVTCVLSLSYLLRNVNVCSSVKE